VGAAGAAVVVAASVLESFALLLVGSVVLGAANAAVFLTRYAAADSVRPEVRGRALGTAFFATALGAVASPLMLGPSGDLATAIGLPRLSGLYGIAIVAFTLAAVTLTASASRIARDQRNLRRCRAAARDASRAGDRATRRARAWGPPRPGGATS
jgi:MFS family permease